MIRGKVSGGLISLGKQHDQRKANPRLREKINEKQLTKETSLLWPSETHSKTWTTGCKKVLIRLHRMTAKVIPLARSELQKKKVMADRSSNAHLSSEWDHATRY